MNRTWITALVIWIKGFYAQGRPDADSLDERTERIFWVKEHCGDLQDSRPYPAKGGGSGKLIANILRPVWNLLMVARVLFADPNFSKSANTPQMCNTKMTQDSLQSRLTVPCRHSQFVLGNQWARCSCKTVCKWCLFLKLQNLRDCIAFITISIKSSTMQHWQDSNDYPI